MLDAKQNRSYQLHICECTEVAKQHEMVKQYITVKNVGISANRGQEESEKEKEATSILERTTRRIEEGFETGLLWRYDHMEFPGSYPMDIHKLHSSERRLKTIFFFEENVRRQIVGYQQKGYVYPRSYS